MIHEINYFPNLSLDKKADGHGFKVKWYSRHLIAMEEPSLLDDCNDPYIHIYRFLWLRTFHQPIGTRLQIRPQYKEVITLKVLSGQGGFDPGELCIQRAIEVNSDRVYSFLDAIDNLGFWELPGSDPNRLGLDGSEWILEGVHAGRYHVVDRWSPLDGSFSEVCLMLVDFSQFEVDEIY